MIPTERRSRRARTTRLVLTLTALLLGALPLAHLRAQSPSGIWLSSADAPPGTPLEALSAPDAPATILGPDELAPPADTFGPASWRVTGSNLKPRENDVSYSINGSGSCTYVTSGDASTVWNTVPDLPNGAVVDTLRMYYNDTSASNSSAWFTVYDLYGTIVNEWSVSSSVGTGNSFNDSAQINHTVDYNLYSYLVNWRPVVTGATMQLCGFRVFYTIPTPVPGVPQGFQASVVGRTVTLSWSAPATGGPATSYVLEAGSALGLSNIVVQPVAGTSFVAGSVPPGRYYLRVRAVNAAGSGPPTGDVVIVVS